MRVDGGYGSWKHDRDCRRMKLSHGFDRAADLGTSVLSPHEPPTWPPRHDILSTPTTCIPKTRFDISHPVEIEVDPKERS